MSQNYSDRRSINLLLSACWFFMWVGRVDGDNEAAVPLSNNAASLEAVLHSGLLRELLMEKLVSLHHL